MKLNQHISLLSFNDEARISNGPIAIKFARLHGFTGGYVSRITKAGVYVKSYNSPDTGIFITNDELNQRTAVRMGVEAAR
jgi:hypothetical protein